MVRSRSPARTTSLAVWYRPDATCAWMKRRSSGVNETVKGSLEGIALISRSDCGMKSSYRAGPLKQADAALAIGHAEFAWRYRNDAAIRALLRQVPEGHCHHTAVFPLPRAVLRRNGHQPSISAFDRLMVVRDVYGASITSDKQHASLRTEEHRETTGHRRCGCERNRCAVGQATQTRWSCARHDRRVAVPAASRWREPADC